MLKIFNIFKIYAILLKKNTLYIWLKVKVSFIFGKKGKCMVSQVGLNQSLVNSNSTQLASLNIPTVSNNSLFSNMPDFSVNNYTNDFMMQNLDFDAMAAGIYPQQNVGQNLPAIAQNSQTLQNPVQAPQVTQTATPAFSGNQELNTSELDGCLAQRDPNLVNTKSGNSYRKTNTFAKTGAVTGFAAPLLVKGFELFKTGNLKNIFKSKQLLVSCPLVAAAGLGIGWLLDGFTNSKRAQSADANAQQQAVVPQTQLSATV